MPGFIVHLGATVTCSHGAPAQPTSVIPRVLVSGQPIVTLPIHYVIAGCPQAAVPAPFCATGQWTITATRVFAQAQPVVLFDSMSVCAATGLPMRVVVTQTRVVGT